MYARDWLNEGAREGCTPSCSSNQPYAQKLSIAGQPACFAAAEAPSTPFRPVANPSFLVSDNNLMPGTSSPSAMPYHQRSLDRPIKSVEPMTPQAARVSAVSPAKRALSLPAPCTPSRLNPAFMMDFMRHARSTTWHRHLFLFLFIIVLALVSVITYHQNFALQHIAHKASTHRPPAELSVHQLEKKNERLSRALQQVQGQVQDLQTEIAKLRKTSKEELTTSQRETAICRQQLEKLQPQQKKQSQPQQAEKQQKVQPKQQQQQQQQKAQ